MANKRGVLALAGAAAGLAVGVAAERSLIRRKRRDDPEAAQDFGRRRGVRPRTIDLNDGARIFIEEAGPGSKKGAVFLHGSALRTDVWHYQMNGIDSQRLVFYDLRGHGMSLPKGDLPFVIETHAHDLHAVIEDGGLDEVVIVGHSIGGMIALQYCLAHADALGSSIKGLILLNTTYAPAFETLTGGAAVAKFERFTRRPFDFIGTQSQRLELLRRVIKPSDAIFWVVSMSGFGPGASARQIDFTYDMLSETPADVIFDLIKSYRDFDVREFLGDIHIPALVIGGTHDRLTEGHASEYIAEHLPKAELHMLEGCGHMSMLERHREVNGLIEAFLGDTLG
jgi:pimeloyl-ACP methyl ester carboxylesterase